MKAILLLRQPEWYFLKTKKVISNVKRQSFDNISRVISGFSRLLAHRKSIGRKKVPITLVLTKTDKYEFLYEETHDWGIAFQKFKERNDVPWIPDFDRIIPVSAVSKTKCNNPAQNFTSEGLDALCWSFWESKQGFMSGVIKRVFRLNASEQHNRLPK